MTSITESVWRYSCLRAEFCLLPQLSWYKFKVQRYNFRMFNVIPMVTIKKIAIEYTEKKGKGS